MHRLTFTSAVAAGFVTLWVALWVYTSQSPLAGRGGEVSYDPLFYPDLLIKLGCALSALLLIREVFHPGAVEQGVARQHFGRVAGAVLLVAAYLLMMKPLGFLISSTLFFATFGLALGFRRYSLLAGAAVVISWIVWAVFTQLLRAPLPAWPTGF